jgi:hypothetical protein
MNFRRPIGQNRWKKLIYIDFSLTSVGLCLTEVSIITVVKAISKEKGQSRQSGSFHDGKTEAPIQARTDIRQPTKTFQAGQLPGAFLKVVLIKRGVLLHDPWLYMHDLG